MPATTDTYAAHHAAPAEQQAAADRLTQVHGALELHAAVLALLLPPGSKRARRAWEIETLETPNAAGLRAHVGHLAGAARLPWLEALLERMALQPLSARTALMQSARRIMGARGLARPIDRLHWLAMRRALGDGGAPAARADPNAEIAEWLETDVLALADYTAFLSRMVPAESADGPAGHAWYDEAMLAWQPFAELPAWSPPSAEAMVRALGRLQTLSPMQLPSVARNWVDTTLKISRGRLHDLPADALRLTCGLLDTPLPPQLAAHHTNLEASEPYLP